MCFDSEAWLWPLNVFHKTSQTIVCFSPSSKKIKKSKLCVIIVAGGLLVLEDTRSSQELYLDLLDGQSLTRERKDSRVTGSSVN